MCMGSATSMRRSVLNRLLPLVVLSQTLLCGRALAEDVQKTAQDLLDRARQISDIRAANAPPFRLSLTFTYIGKDLETMKGTYTELWMSNTQWRRETVVGTLAHVEVGGPTQRWFLDNDNDFPDEAGRIASIVALLPEKTEKLEFETLTTPDAATLCVVTKPVGHKHSKRAFCFDKDQHVLVENIAPVQVGQHMGDYSCSFGDFRKFAECWFPRHIQCFQDGHEKMQANVVELEVAPATSPSSFTPPPGSIEIGVCSVTPKPPEAISTRDPISPLGMRDRPLAVHVSMIIDTKGQPQHLKISPSVGKSYDERVLFALKAWRFKPATCNGQPIAVPITVELDNWNYR